MPEDEWRPLTVLACQLVDVSEHAAPLDREAWLEVVRDYHAMCTEVMQRFDGHLAQSQGERLLVYFGYPRAHEDDARRAVLTGLGMVEGMAAAQQAPSITTAACGWRCRWGFIRASSWWEP